MGPLLGFAAIALAAASGAYLGYRLVANLGNPYGLSESALRRIRFIFFAILAVLIPAGLFLGYLVGRELFE